MPATPRQSPRPAAPEAVDPEAPALAGVVLMNQDWRDLTFLHWAVDPDRVAALMPAGVRPDVLDGATYVGLVPFRMVGAGLGRRTSVPWAGTFLETNVRLYSVDRQGRRGVVFLSLDADRLPVVLAARACLALPYRWARMRHTVLPGPTGTRAEPGTGAVHTYSAALRWPGHRARSRVRVRVGPPREPSALDHFVSARWRLHTQVGGQTLRVANRHERWPLHDAEVATLDDELLGSVGFGDLAVRPPDQTAYSPGVHTVFGLPRRAR